MTETPDHFLLNCKEHDTERAKLEKYIKKTFYKNNYHKLNTYIKELLGEYDLPSQYAVISGNGKRNLKLKHESTVMKFFVLKFLFICSFYFICISPLLLFEYACI